MGFIYISILIHASNKIAFVRDQCTTRWDAVTPSTSTNRYWYLLPTTGWSVTTVKNSTKGIVLHNKLFSEICQIYDVSFELKTVPEPLLTFRLVFWHRFGEFVNWYDAQTFSKHQHNRRPPLPPIEYACAVKHRKHHTHYQRMAKDMVDGVT